MPDEPREPKSFDDAYREVVALCDHFVARRSEIIKPGYKEASARVEFITPLFQALGWDVDNRAHKSVYEKDCVLEKAERIDGNNKSADYAFRRPGSHMISFFVEAKKPSVDLRSHENCYQAINYGWNESTPLVVLTNFDRFLILDSRTSPDKKNATRHILKSNGSYRFDEYRDKEKFEEIWGLFSRDNVANGSIEKAGAALPKLSGRVYAEYLIPRGKHGVDDVFLAHMELWRAKLAAVLKRDNQGLDSLSLTALTQRMLDRLVFLRFLEDKGIEREISYDHFSKGESAWNEFLKISKRLNARYNGIIYKEDRFGCESPDLRMDDTLFAEIVGALHPRNSDYRFGQIPVSILGSIYERFLGNVIVVDNNIATVEKKPEVREARGVYYTPDYIVRYIVENTVGKALVGKTPKQISDLHFADIACGSGSFLVEVFGCVIRYHLSWYLDPR